jgi:hypothetical protein
MKEKEIREAWLKESSIATKRLESGTLISLGLHEDWGDADAIADWWLALRAKELGEIRKEVNDRDCTTGFNAQYNDQFHEARGYHRANLETLKALDELIEKPTT